MTVPIATVRFAPDVVVHVTGDEAVLLKLTDETAFSLNATAARIVALIAEGVAVPAIVDRLAAEYGAPRSSVATDGPALLERLASKGLVDIGTEDARP